MTVVPTRTELVRRWLVTPCSWSSWAFRSVLTLFWRGYKASPFLVGGAVIGSIIPVLGLLFVQLGGGHELFVHGHSGSPSTGLTGVLVGAERLLCLPFAATMFLGWIS